MKNLLATTLSLLALGAALPAQAQEAADTTSNFAIINAKVVTNEGPVLDNATVLVRGGQIAAIGRTDESANAPQPNGASIIDGTGLWVTPGIFAPYSRLGLVEVSLEAATNDQTAGDSKAQAALRAADSFNPKSSPISASRSDGITHSAISGGNSGTVFGGIGAIVDLSGDFDSIINPAAFAFVELGSGGGSDAGGSRGAALMQLRQGLDDAANFRSKIEDPDDGDVLSRADAEAMIPVVQGRIPLIIAAERASDLVAIAGLKDQFPRLNIIIIGASEGWLVADELAAAQIAVIVDPTENLPYNFDRVASSQDNAAKLSAAGVPLAIMSRTSDLSHNVRLLPLHAGNAVAQGLSWDEAFKAITLTPARMFGQGDLGTLSQGQTANFVVWDGDPMEAMTGVVRVVIDGETRSTASRQSELARRYKPDPENTVPYGYRK